jgi:polar amino acid transport system substrate-binding protein
MVSQKGEVSGLAYEVITEIGNRFGCRIVQNPSNFPRMIEDFTQWRTDLIGFVDNNPGLAQSGMFLPLVTLHRKIVILKSLIVKNRTVPDYVKDAKVKFCTQVKLHPLYSSDEVDMLTKSGRLVQVPSPETVHQMILDGRAQAFFSTAAEKLYLLEHNPSLSQKMTSITDPSFNLTAGLFISKKRFSIAEKKMLENIVKEIRNDGTLRRIISKYVSKEDLSDFEDLH